jgi:hypothetical protein
MPEYRERADDFGPSSAGFGVEGGKVTVSYFVDDEDLDATIVDLLGGVSRRGDGSLTRKLPKAHPRFPWMFASRIETCVGWKSNKSADSDGTREAEPFLEAETMEKYGTWEEYLLTVVFEPRPYPVLPDSAITARLEAYYDEDGSPVNATVANEWDRFTYYEFAGGPELITAQHGQMVFATGSLATPPAPPKGFTFSGFPRMLVPGCTLIYHWVQVPASVVDSANSYLMDYQGYINQLDWDGWPAGSLLYDRIGNVKRYTPPYPAEVVGPGGVGFSVERLCDVELIFKYTKRNVQSPPTPANPNWIAAGHNCPPWLVDRKFYYVQNSTSDTENQAPTFLSIPFSLLFSDPDVA